MSKAPSYRQFGRLYIEWGDGLLIHLGRRRPLIVALRIQVKRSAFDRVAALANEKQGVW